MSYKRTEIDEAAIARQMDICDRIRERAAALASAPKALVDTYGCQQNEADSEKLRGMLRRMGYEMTSDENEADVVVVNTCAVREHAEMRVLGNVGALTHTKRRHRGQIIVMCGCMVQQEHMAEKIRRSFRIVDLVFGPHELWRFPELLERVMTESGRVFAVDASDGVIAEGLPSRRAGGVKAWLPISYGCNNFCSYCVVPLVRGRERSRDPGLIINDAAALIADGVKDITLLGQNVNSYGRDLDSGTDFSDLLRAVCSLEGNFVVRFMTSHPKDATEKLFKTMAECPKCENHIHLPVQSGSNRILEAMNRRYTKEKYLAQAALARSYIPDLVLTTDIIVGFPGETDGDFEETLDLVRQVGFDAAFTFIYSKRVGTPAASMPDPFTREDKQRHFDMLIDELNSISETIHAGYVGRTVNVLVDGESGDARYNLTSRTHGGRLVHLRGDSGLIGKFIDVRITDSRTWALFGEAI